MRTKKEPVPIREILSAYNLKFGTRFKSMKQLLSNELQRYQGFKSFLKDRMDITYYQLNFMLDIYDLNHLAQTKNGRPPIIWEDVVFEYNQRNKTEFKVSGEMLQNLYGKFMDIRRVGEDIRVCCVEVRKEMRRNGIKSNQRGGTTEQRRARSKFRPKLLAIPDKTTKDLTISQLAKRVGCKYSTMCKLLIATGKPFIKGRGKMSCIDNIYDPLEEHGVNF